MDPELAATSQDRREQRRGEPMRGPIVLAAFFALAPLAAVSGGMMLAPMQPVAAFFGLPLRFSLSQLKGFLLAIAPLMAFAAWAAVTSLWSPVSDPSPLTQAGKIAGGLFAGAVFVAIAAGAGRHGRMLIRNAGIAAFLVLGVALLAEAFADMPFNRLGQPTTETGLLMRNPGKGASILVVLTWGFLAAALGRRRLMGMIWLPGAALAAVLSLQFDMNTNTAGLAVGALVFAFTRIAPKLMPILVAGGVAAWTLIAPFLSAAVGAIPSLAERVPLSWRMRIDIWEFACARIREKPFTGWGLNASRGFAETSQIGTFEFKLLPLHPHSFSLHVWLETGAIGAGLLAAGILGAGLVISRTLRAHPDAAAGATAALAAAATIWNVSYGAFQEWWVTAPFAAAALAAAARR